MSGTETEDVDGSNPYGISDSAGNSISGWLRGAILESVRREPLMATEDAIMLADIAVALSTKAIAFGKIIANPLLGEWLKKAVRDNLRRPADEVLHDTECLRNLLVVNLLTQYRNGLLDGADIDMRVCNVMDMTWGEGKGALSQWSRDAATQLREILGKGDAGFSDIRECLETESARGHEEMVEIFEQMSCLPESDLRGHLRMMSDGLTTMTNQLQ